MKQNRFFVGLIAGLVLVVTMACGLLPSSQKVEEKVESPSSSEIGAAVTHKAPASQVEQASPQPKADLAGGAQVEFPLPKDAQNVTSIEGSVNFQTKLSLKEAMEFYRQELTRQGLSERTILTNETDATFSMVFDGSSNQQALVVQGVELGEDSTNINIRYEDI